VSEQILPTAPSRVNSPCTGQGSDASPPAEAAPLLAWTAEGFPRLAALDFSSRSYLRDVGPASPEFVAAALAPGAFETVARHAWSSAGPGPRVEDSPGPTQLNRRLVGTFDPIPQAFHDDIAAGWIPAMAGPVLAHLLRFAYMARENGYGDGKSAWAVCKALGEACGRSSKQIRNILKPVIARGWIARVVLGDGIDLIDPRNRTGQRWQFLWMTGEGPARDPNEAPPVKPKRGRPPGGGRKFISGGAEIISGGPEAAPGGEIHFHARGKFISPNQDGNLREEQKDNNNSGSGPGSSSRLADALGEKGASEVEDILAPPVASTPARAEPTPAPAPMPASPAPALASAPLATRPEPPPGPAPTPATIPPGPTGGPKEAEIAEAVAGLQDQVDAKFRKRDRPVRAEVKARVDGWLRNLVEATGRRAIGLGAAVDLILDAFEGQAKADTNVVGYIEGTIANMARKFRATGGAGVSGPPAAPPKAAPSRVPSGDVAQQYRDADAATQKVNDASRARWEALTEAERGDIRANVVRAKPGTPSIILTALCHHEMDMRAAR